MRVEGEQSERTSFENPDLRLLFAAPVFTQHKYPEGGRGPAAYWLPLLTMFNGARQAELAGLTVADVQQEPVTSTPLLYIITASRGKRLKTKASQRVVPIHDQLVRLGFLGYVGRCSAADGGTAFLSPLVAPNQGRAGVARGRSGSAIIFALKALPIPPRSFTPSGTASRTHCGKAGLIGRFMTLSRGMLRPPRSAVVTEPRRCLHVSA